MRLEIDSTMNTTYEIISELKDNEYYLTGKG